MEHIHLWVYLQTPVLNVAGNNLNLSFKILTLGLETGFPQSWKILKKKVVESYGKVMGNSENSEFHGNLFARKKVMEKS